MFTSISRKSALTAVVVTLTIATVQLWSFAVSAATFEEGTCTARPMVQGKAGEWVTTCELRNVTVNPVRAVARKATRTGRTVIVARMGERAPTVVASR